MLCLSRAAGESVIIRCPDGTTIRIVALAPWRDKSAEELAQEKAAVKKKGGRPELY